MNTTNLQVSKHVCRAIREIDRTLWFTNRHVRPGRHLLDARKSLMTALHEYGFAMTAGFQPKRRLP